MVRGMFGALGRLVRHRLFQVLVSLAVGAALLWLAIARIDLAGLGARAGPGQAQLAGGGGGPLLDRPHAAELAVAHSADAGAAP